MGRNQSPLADWTHTTRAMGKPQNKAESPRSRRPSALSNSALGAESGMRACSDVEVGIFPKTTLIIIKEAHGLGGLHAIGLYGLFHLGFHLPLQLVLVVLHRGERLADGCAFNYFL